MNVDELMEKYCEMFDDQFPLMLCRHMSEEEIIKTLQECIEKEEPYEPNLDPNANY